MADHGSGAICCGNCAWIGCDAYSKALALAGGESGRVNLPALQQKLQSLVPVPARSIEIEPSAETIETAPATKDSVDVPEE